MYRPKVESLVSGFHDYLEDIFRSRGKKRTDKKEEIDERLKNLLENIFCAHDEEIEKKEGDLEKLREKYMKAYMKLGKLEVKYESTIEDLKKTIEFYKKMKST